MAQHPKPDGSLDFELTDLDEARRVLDLLPDGLIEAREARDPDYWTMRRRSPMPTDRALSGDTLDWIIGLPPEIRPTTLCERFPRIANAVAQAWPNPAHCTELLDGLLTDRRGKRRGFPAETQLELERLGAYRATRR